MRMPFYFLDDRGRIDFAFLKKLRCENSSNKKTLKQAWRFFLSNYLLVTAAGFKPVSACPISKGF
jgi:hypothetical protein